MRANVDARLANRAHEAAMSEAVSLHEERAAAKLERTIRRYVRSIAASFVNGHLTVLAAAPEGLPEWRMPMPVDLLDAAGMQAELDAHADALAADAATSTARSVALSLAIAPDLSNRLLRGVIAAQSGRRITTAPADLVETMMGSLQESYEAGLSIPNAARAMRRVGYTSAKGYAERIARTELIGAVNASSLAQVQGATTIQYKQWLATADSRTRETHDEADGQTVPLEGTFQVGGYDLEFPGDPNGPPEEIINCRCTLTYTDEPGDLNTIAGGSMAAVDTTPEIQAVGAAWSGVVAQEGVDTGDGRRIAEGALNWRELPLTLMAQHTTPDFGGHAEAQIAGRIDTLQRSGSDIVGGGIFDTGEWGTETQRMVTDGMLKGISIDLAVNEAEVVPPENPVDEMDEMFGGTLIVLDGTILGATVVAFPAFENASIAIVAGAAMRLSRFRRDDEGRAVASFYMPFAPFPPGDGKDPKPANTQENNSDAADAIADIKDAINGWPGLDGQVVITIDGQDTTVKFPPAKAATSKQAASPEVIEALAILRDHIMRRDRG